jgi:hypothetical protein
VHVHLSLSQPKRITHTAAMPPTVVQGHLGKRGFRLFGVAALVSSRLSRAKNNNTLTKTELVINLAN